MNNSINSGHSTSFDSLSRNMMDQNITQNLFHEPDLSFITSCGNAIFARKAQKPSVRPNLSQIDRTEREIKRNKELLRQDHSVSFHLDGGIRQYVALDGCYLISSASRRMIRFVDRERRRFLVIIECSLHCFFWSLMI